jgi:hypothetical protein
MLKITNGYEWPITVVSRNVRGQDGESVEVAPRQSASIEIDGDNQAVLSTGAFGQSPSSVPFRAVLEEGAGGGVELTEATDDQVTAHMVAMRAEGGTNLTAAGTPALPKLNERLAADGFAPITGARRAALFSALPAA